MAVISRITTLQLSSLTGGTRTWTATAAVQDTSAGSSVVVTVTSVGAGTVPPPAEDTLSISYRIDNGATVVKSVSLTAGSASQTNTFFFTDTGNAGTARAGTIRMRLYAVNSTGTPTDRYTVNSDDTTGQTLGTGQTVTIRNQGWIRATTTSTQTLSNISLGGAKDSPFQYTDSLFLRTTLGSVLYTASTLTVSIGSVRSGSTNSATSGNYDISFTGTSTTTGRVNSGFTASSASYATGIAIPNATLTSLPAFVVTNTSDSATIDPRVTVLHLMQIDNNTYAIPPMSDPNLATQRVFPSNAYIATNLRGARGDFSSPVVTGGINGLTFDITFIANATGQNFGSMGLSTSTQGGETGWQNIFLIWTAVVGGSWTKTVHITVSDITDAYLINPSVDYLLIAVNPNLRASLIIGSNRPGTHIIAGATIEVDAQLFDNSTHAAIEPDSITVLLRRVNSSDKAQHWNGSAWENSYDGTTPPVPVPGVVFEPTQVSTDQWLYRRAFSTDVTWTNDFEVVANLVKDGVIYSTTDVREMVSTYNAHDDSSGGGEGGGTSTVVLGPYFTRLSNLEREVRDGKKDLSEIEKLKKVLQEIKAQKQEDEERLIATISEKFDFTRGDTVSAVKTVKKKKKPKSEKSILKAMQSINEDLLIEQMETINAETLLEAMGKIDE